MQVRLATSNTSEDYVNGKLWQRATLNRCPWHPKGGCGFARHGTYTRVRPANTRIARWYCPTARATVSALPDCFSSHRSGTLDECEALVRAVEQAPSLAAACRDLRTDIELPGALRFLGRLVVQVQGALRAIKGLMPTTFTGTATLLSFAADLAGTDSQHVLMSLRHHARHHLAELPTPIGFNPHLNGVHKAPYPNQHRAGRDPPSSVVEACVAARTCVRCGSHNTTRKP